MAFAKRCMNTLQDNVSSMLCALQKKVTMQQRCSVHFSLDCTIAVDDAYMSTSCLTTYLLCLQECFGQVGRRAVACPDYIVGSALNGY